MEVVDKKFTGEICGGIRILTFWDFLEGVDGDDVFDVVDRRFNQNIGCAKMQYIFYPQISKR